MSDHPSKRSGDDRHDPETSRKRRSRSPEDSRHRDRSRDRDKHRRYGGHDKRREDRDRRHRSRERERSRSRGRSERERRESDPPRPPREDWAKDEEGYWSRRLKRVADNPHLCQLSQNELQVVHEDQLVRVLTDGSPRLPYRRRRGERKSTVHWGQRKLLLSEIEFLTLYSEPSITVVYAGAAPGTHIGYLSRLFPEVARFVLVDPSPFTCQPSDRIVVRNEYMTTEVAKEFAGVKTLLISDIRTAQWRHMQKDEIERAVAQDMTWQRDWHEAMQPKAGMYKFRLPWQAGQTEYLDGEIYLPIWGPQTTTEARLVSRGGTRLWDNTAYEEMMFYFNTVTRLTACDHDVEADGLDHCFDCASEVHVLRRYLTKYAHLWLKEGEELGEGQEVSRDRIRGEISKMVDRISHECSPHSGRTLRTFVQAPDERKQAVWFKSAQFDPQGRKLTAVADKEENMANAARMSSEAVMRDALANGTASSTADPTRALWTELAEPTLGDLSYAEAKRGMEGLGDDVPPRSFLYQWVVSVTLSVVLGPEATSKVRGVASFNERVAEDMLGPTLRAAYVAPGSSEQTARGVLVLSCKSGTVYLVEAASADKALPATVTRLMLPLPSGEGGEGAPSYHHLTVLSGMLSTSRTGSSSEAGEWTLTCLDALAMEGERLLDRPQAERLEVLLTRVAAPLQASRSHLAGVHMRSGIHHVRFGSQEADSV